MRDDRDDLRAWSAMASTKGIGPAAVYRIATGLRAQQMAAGRLLGFEHGEIVDAMVSFGASTASATALADALTSSPAMPPSSPGASIVHPDSRDYPFARLHPKRPLPALLYARGLTTLLDQDSVAIVGSRDASDADCQLAHELAQALATNQRNVVSGHARGIDHAGHAGAIAGGGTTTAVLAEGIEGFRPREGVVGDEHSTLVVSQFPPDARWRGYRAMARNATMAALVQAVVVVRSSDSGGTREMIRYSSQRGLPVIAVEDNVPPSLHGEVTTLAAADPDDVVRRVVDSAAAAPATLF